MGHLDTNRPYGNLLQKAFYALWSARNNAVDLGLEVEAERLFVMMQAIGDLQEARVSKRKLRPNSPHELTRTPF